MTAPINQLMGIGATTTLPALVAAAGERASMRFLEFFAANIRNPHTRRAYYRAADEFLTWCASAGLPSIAAVQPVHVATWIEASTRELAVPSVKQRLAAIRHLFDWLVTRPSRAGQSGRLGTRAPACRYVRANAGTRSSRGAGAARQHRCLNSCRSARSRADRADGLLLRPQRCGAGDDGRGCLHAEPAAVGAA